MVHRSLRERPAGVARLNQKGDIVRLMEGETDAQLMGRFQRDRDVRAFETLFRRHKDRLLHFLERLAGSTTIAEEVSQQTWTKVIDVARRGAFLEQPGAGFSTWLCTLARNHFIDEHTRKFAATRTVPLSDDGGEVALDREPVSDALELIDRQQRAHHVQRALRTLPLEQREVIAFWVAGMGFDSIAAIVGAPRETVLSRKKYAIAKLRAALAALIPEAGDA